jgi:tetratricopeptide (TPR) repeat protein
MIDWSYDILTENERLLLRRLSVFAGGWTLDAAEEVCSRDGIETYDVLDFLTQLVNKSLVVVMEGSQSGETRFRMLETIRQYGREKLLEVGGGEMIRDRHLAYVVRLAEQAEPELYRSNQVFWLNKLEDELDNLRLALELAIKTDVKSGLRLIIASRYFWDVYGDNREIKSWLDHLLERYSDADSLRAKALVIYGRLLAELGDSTEAQKIANQSLEISRSISDQQTEAFSLWGLGVNIALQGDLKQGIPIVEQSLALYQSQGDKLGQATAMEWLSLNNNDLERSKSYIVDSLRLYRELGHLSGIAVGLYDLANQMIWEGDFSSPIPLLEEARMIYRQLGSQFGEAFVLEDYGRLAFWQGDYQQAFAYYEEALTLAEKFGAYNFSVWIRGKLAYILLRQGNLVRAKEIFELCSIEFQNANNMGGLVFVIEGFASLHVNQSQPERAAQLFAWADAMRDQIGDHRPPIEQASVERDLEVVYSTLNQTEFEKLSTEGRAMSTEQAIALALGG